MVDIETSHRPGHQNLHRYHHQPSPSSGIFLSNDSCIFPARLSILSISQPKLPSANTEYIGCEDSLRVIVTDATPKKKGGELSKHVE